MRWNVLKYTVTFVLPILMFVSIQWKGIWSWGPALYAFCFIPFMELFTKPDNRNLTAVEASMIKKDAVYDILLYAVVLIQYVLLIYFLEIWSTPQILSLNEKIGLIFSMGIMCGTYGINIGHELGHRKSAYERVLAKMALLSSLYMHFFIEHNRGHHKRVATVEDPATSRKGETVYTFWLRSILMGYVSAWKLERQRLTHRRLSVLSWKNEMIRIHVYEIGALVCIGWIWGVSSLIAFMGAACIGILLLETVNYIEHYGLQREKLDNGGYERVQIDHSWNSNHVMGRLTLFELSRHSDHHYMASKKYQCLKHHDRSPQMPTGYPGMMLLSLVPPVWFWVMHREMEKIEKNRLAY